MEPALGRGIGCAPLYGARGLALLCRAAGVICGGGVPLIPRRLPTRVRVRSKAHRRFAFGRNPVTRTVCGLSNAGERFLYLYALEALAILLAGWSLSRC